MTTEYFSFELLGNNTGALNLVGVPLKLVVFVGKVYWPLGR